MEVGYDNLVIGCKSISD